MEAIQEAEDTRQVFVQCSGMHTPYVQWIIHQICFRTWWVKHPMSCADFVIPALSNGIAQHWENLVAAQAEIAVYASLFMTLYIGMYLGGIAPANHVTEFKGSKEYTMDNMRQYGHVGQAMGLSLGVFNIFCAVIYRLAGSFLPRESDKLVMMWACRWMPLVNVVAFLGGIFMGMIYALESGEILMWSGDHCMDGSARYVTWYMEWVLKSYPTGKGVIHPLDQPVLNPWAVAADAAGIKRPDALSHDEALPSIYVEKSFFGNGKKHHASFLAYQEFMVDYLELQGGGCHGGKKEQHWSLLVLLFLLPALLTRLPSFYWFRPWRAKKDPYDVSVIYQEFKVRATIGQELADKDKNKNGFVEPEDEGIYVLESAKHLLGEDEAPSQIELDEPVLAALQRAAIDPENLRPYAEDTPLRDHRLLHMILQDAGVSDVGARFKAIMVLSGAEDPPGEAASGATGNQPGKAKAHQVTPISA